MLVRRRRSFCAWVHRELVPHRNDLLQPPPQLQLPLPPSSGKQLALVPWAHDDEHDVVQSTAELGESTATLSTTTLSTTAKTIASTLLADLERIFPAPVVDSSSATPSTPSTPSTPPSFSLPGDTDDDMLSVKEEQMLRFVLEIIFVQLVEGPSSLSTASTSTSTSTSTLTPPPSTVSTPQPPPPPTPPPLASSATIRYGESLDALERFLRAVQEPTLFRIFATYLLERFFTVTIDMAMAPHPSAAEQDPVHPSAEQEREREREQERKRERKRASALLLATLRRCPMKLNMATLLALMAKRRRDVHHAEGWWRRGCAGYLTSCLVRPGGLVAFLELAFSSEGDARANQDTTGDDQGISTYIGRRARFAESLTPFFCSSILCCLLFYLPPRLPRITFLPWPTTQS